MFEYAWYHAEATYSRKVFYFLLDDLTVRPSRGKFHAIVHSVALLKADLLPVKRLQKVHYIA